LCVIRKPGVNVIIIFFGEKSAFFLKTNFIIGPFFTEKYFPKKMGIPRNETFMEFAKAQMCE
jgi:hypothetical protein